MTNEPIGGLTPTGGLKPIGASSTPPSPPAVESTPPVDAPAANVGEAIQDIVEDVTDLYTMISDEVVNVAQGVARIVHFVVNKSKVDVELVFGHDVAQDDETVKAAVESVAGGQSK